MVKVRVQAWWEKEQGKPLVWHEHEVEVLKRWHEDEVPDPRAYATFKLDGREVTVERFTVEDWKNWIEHEEKENLTTWYSRVAYIDIKLNDVKLTWIEPEGQKSLKDIWLETKSPDSFQEIFRLFGKTLAIYRLMWYFGPPYRRLFGDESACQFRVKHRGYVFEIQESPEDRLLDLQSLFFVPKGELWKLETERKYEPPTKIQEEIATIIEFVVDNPVMLYGLNIGNMPV